MKIADMIGPDDEVIEEYDMDTVLDFGKYSGQTVEDVIYNERPDYILWAETNTNKSFSTEVLDAAEKANDR